MNKKGFTLVELLATIVLLAIIVAIAIPAVNTILNKNKKNNCETLKDSLIRAAEAYVSDNKYAIFNGTEATVTVSTKSLYNKSYLNNKVTNPCDNKVYNEDIQMVFENNNGNITFKKFTDDWKNIFDCCK